MSIHFLNSNDYDWQHLKETFLKYTKKSSIVLEIGASNVKRTKEIASKVKKVIGVEYRPDRLPVNFANISYRLGDWQNLSKVITPNSIDQAFSSHVIEHVPDDLKAINELYLVLKPKGIAVINTPNRQRLTRKIVEIFTGPRKFPFWEHVREYSYSDLVTLLNVSKFSKWTITPIVLGFHAGGNFKLYSTSVPKILINFSNYWEILLIK